MRVCVCICISEGEQMACMYPVVSAWSSGWPPWVFTPEIATDWLETSLSVWRASPGQEEINSGRFIFRSHILNVYSPSFFYGRELEVENTWLLSLSLVFTEAFALLFFRLSSVCNTVRQQGSSVGAVKTVSLQHPIYNCLYFLTDTSISRHR